jgi:4-alpha-glucanotransferase
VIILLQDIPGLDADVRMNKPAGAEGNRLWRLKADRFADDSRDRLVDWTERVGRN